MKCPEMVLNLIKNIAFGLCILYAMDQNKDMMYYLQKGTMIGGCMILVEYVIRNICRDVRENFTSGPNGIGDEEDETPVMTPVSTPTQPMEEEVMETTAMPMEENPTTMTEEDKEIQQLIDESMEMEEQEQEEQEEKQKIEYGYSFVHPDAMKLPEVRIPKCLQDNPCNVCPVMMGGTADLMTVKPRKKPIAGCGEEY